MSLSGFHPVSVPRAPAVELTRTAPGKPAIRCGFCGRFQHQVGHLVTGRTSAFICDDCVIDAAALVTAAREAAR